ncbi:MAG: type II secretion system F family protein [Candidatus Omnitrophica bacterium]|nr:type II secretion system F family protein [Candidatus Omnitrophota bacterium]
MAIYQYKVFNTISGELLSGVMECESEFEVLNKFNRNFLIIEVKKKKEKRFFSLQRITKNEIALLTKNLSIILKAGLPILSAIDILIKENPKTKIQKLLKKIRSDLSEGQELSYSLGKFPNYFNRVYVTVVKVGEKSGNLAEVLERIYLYLNREINLKKKIRTAMFYPTIVILVMVVVLGFFVFFIFPKYEKFYRSLNIELPKITKFFMGLPTIFHQLFIYLLVTIPIFILFIHIFGKLNFIKTFFDGIKMKLPIFGPLYKKINVSFYCESLEMLLNSGVGILSSIKIAQETVPSIIIRKQLTEVEKIVREGKGLSVALKQKTLFPILVSALIGVGETIGDIESYLRDISEIYNEEVDNTLRNLTTIIEPFLLIIIGGVVLSIALALYLPIFNLVKYIK